MKNALKSLVMLLLVGVVASCSQSDKMVATQSNDAPVRYHKVYEGNKIIYKENDDNVESEKLLLNENEVALEVPEEIIEPLPEKSRTDWEAIRDKKIASNGEKDWFGEVKVGTFLKSDSERLKAEKPEKKNDRSTLASLGFIFGFLSTLIIVLSFVGISAPVLGLFAFIFALLGLIFSILGLNSEKRGLAVAGLVLSCVYFLLVIVAVILFAAFLSSF